MQTVRRELARLWRCVTERRRWELAFAVAVSAWVLAWVLAQAGPSRPSPLDVVRGAVGWAGAPSGWLASAGEWFDNPERHGVLTWVAVFGGLLWAATTERAQLPALGGWLAVLAAAEGLGYHPALYLALAAMVGLVVLLTLIALPGKPSFMPNRIVLIPKDVLRAGATAAALAAMVPLLAVGMLVIRLVRPYVTRPGGVRPSRPLPRCEESQDGEKHARA